MRLNKACRGKKRTAKCVNATKGFKNGCYKSVSIKMLERNEAHSVVREIN